MIGLGEPIKGRPETDKQREHRWHVQELAGKLIRVEEAKAEAAEVQALLKKDPKLKQEVKAYLAKTIAANKKEAAETAKVKAKIK